MKAAAKTPSVAWLEIYFAAIMILFGTVLPLSLYKFNQPGTVMTAWGLEAVSAFGLGLQFLIYLTKASRRPLKIYLLLSSAISASLLAAALF